MSKEITTLEHSPAAEGEHTVNIMFLYLLFFVQEEFGQNRLTALQEAAWLFGQTLQLATV